MDRMRLKRARSLRRAIFAKARNAMLAQKKAIRSGIATNAGSQKKQAFPGYDPELVYVECGRCGAPVIWEQGKATQLLAEAGIDPIELDASCILVTDACPACGSKNEYGVRIFRIAADTSPLLSPPLGHA